MLTKTFSYLKDGTVSVDVKLFSYKRIAGDKKEIDDKTFGFTLDRSKSLGLSNYVDSVPKCPFEESEDETKDTVLFKFDLKNLRVLVERHGTRLKNLTVVSTHRNLYLQQHGLQNNDASQDDEEETTPQPKTESKAKSSDKEVEGEAKKEKTQTKFSAKDAGDSKETSSEKKQKSDEVDSTSKSERRRRAAEEKEGDKKTEASVDTKEGAEKAEGTKSAQTVQSEPVDTGTGNEKATKESKKTEVMSGTKTALVNVLPITTSMEGDMIVYKTYFLVHLKSTSEEGLYNLFFHNCLLPKGKPLVNLTLKIIQDNNGNFLSADEMPIPSMYFLFSIVFFILTVVWVSVLRKAEEGVYKIHFLMTVVVSFKCLSDLFHGVNMYMIQRSGIHVDAWAILWYIVYLMRGAVMFVTVLLIGAGWAFIKHVFTDREKKLFLIVIPLQILMNVAWVIVEESEEGYAAYNTWHKIFIGVDLLCCFAILFPVIWSIRHLQEASKTDGKAAINLNKLKLFRHFYIMVVAYIYFTRIIGYLLVITLPFGYGWLKDLFEEVFLLVFFTLTGYKFRPTSDNPYLQVPQDSEDEEDIEMDEVITKSGATETLVRVNQGKKEDETSMSIKQRESSHEYD